MKYLSIFHFTGKKTKTQMEVKKHLQDHIANELQNK